MKFTKKEIKIQKLEEKITELEADLAEIKDYESEEYQLLGADLIKYQDELDELIG